MQSVVTHRLQVAGVPVKKTLIIIYAKAAAMYGLAGFMMGAKAGGASVRIRLWL